ncbi:acyl-CoA dehydrogenase family protein [Streptomyces griseus]|uniref:acyl-CoA dehydrogenase family protein n=1 Tax=Streptomyces griseus TaxID=1911 RepID=UPI00056977DE|nr:acyl-CoA dehydrogenase family protein [Streptomyces griseus]
MERDEFTLVRDMLRAFATRFRSGSADDVKAQTRTDAQRALDELGLSGLRRTSPPAATVQECALLAEEHGRQPLTTSLLGTALLAPELLRLLDLGERAEPVHGDRPTVALAGDLRFPDRDAVGLVAWDCDGADTALFVHAEGRVTEHELGTPAPTADLLRGVRRASAEGRPVGRLTPGAHQRWQAYALVVVASELVGAARSFVEQSVDYARERHQYGQPIGSFQAVQHQLADATVLVEACTSATRYAAWCLDSETPGRALTAARVAKAEVNSSAVEAVYAGMQVFGGIAQTWEHVAHLYLRRVLVGATTLATTADLLTVLAAPEATR